jgi:sialate O-acetylesterase
MRSAIFVSTFLLLTLPCAFAANAFIASTLGSHMVLQRGVSTSVYGWSSCASCAVTVTMGNSTYSATSSASPSAAGGFFWQVPLPAVAASLLGIDIHISSAAGEAATLSDVLFGDVFFCSGQSNMQFAMPGVLDAQQQIARADNYSAIRIFDVGQDMNQPQSVNPLDDLFSLRRGWTVSRLLPLCCTLACKCTSHPLVDWKRRCYQQR